MILEKRINKDSKLVHIEIKDSCLDANKNQKVRVGNTYTYNVVLKILSNRNISEFDSFLNPSLSNLHDPFLLNDMDLAVERTVAAIKERSNICIVGDYDVDGITACSILVNFFREISVPCSYYIPKRVDGYGLSLNAIKFAHQQSAKLIITVDNGISSQDEIEFARILGIDVIITDHHEPVQIPKAYAVVNPKVKTSHYPFRDLAGVGVAFNFLLALRKRLRDINFFKKEPNLAKFLDLVSLGTLADVVPLIDVNRVFVRYGLKRNSNKALERLKYIANIENDLSVHDISFKIAPRINSAGRLADANLAIDLFTTTQEQKVQQIAAMLDELNVKRKKLQQTTLKEAKEKIYKMNSYLAIVVSGKWHRGVIGIVAGNLSNLYQKPAIVISEDNPYSIGSGRSVESIDLFDAIKRNENLLEKFGGHQQAVGITIRKELIPALRDAINNEIARKYTQVCSQLKIDCECKIELFENEDFLLKLKDLAPFGNAFEEPVFFIRNGILKDIHNKTYNKTCLFDFNGKIKTFSTDNVDNLKLGAKYSVAFSIMFNKSYNNFVIKDIFEE